MPLARCMWAIMPTIAALSVQSVGLARRNTKPSRSHAAPKAARKPLLHVTPPEAVTHFSTELFCRADCLGDEHFDDRRLHAGAKVAQLLAVLEHVAGCRG